MLPKINFMSETKCLAVFLMGNQWPFKKRVQILGLLWILLGKANFVLLMKAQITRKKINCFSRIMLGQVTRYQQLIVILNLVKIKNSKDIYGSSRCKATFGFEYILCAVIILFIP